jgi:hypothetical protein
MDDEKTRQQEEQAIQYLNSISFKGQFLLTPDIKLEEDFSIIDKNLAITNLKQHPKYRSDEVGEARSILRGFSILNNLKHFQEEKVLEFKGVQPKRNENGEVETDKEGKIILERIYTEKTIKKSKFPLTYHTLQAEFIGLTNTTASRDGHRIEAVNKTILEKSESLDHQTSNQKQRRNY